MRLELMTSWSQTRHDNHYATLRLYKNYKIFLARAGFEPTLLDHEPNELANYSILPIKKNKMRVRGLEPLTFAWKANHLPINSILAYVYKI